ncbi:hypothetical protein [Dialister micraerophilus]|uniref:Uncharacterized protein n=1 Tax=Dialister micraerophilus UPII 345-E TaxID=910314 RepID=E4L7F2_9FIRM|nr:hypothetical protein [Dialister micraerophilus]EFR43399.1 hypothetical protein HMPREF9220_1301 [Dialister micraerophilus UPII 345-E]
MEQIRVNGLSVAPKVYNPSSFSLGEKFVSEIISSKADMTPELIVIQYVIKSPLAKTAVKIGGVTLLMTGYEMYQDYYKYDGWNLSKAWAADAVPIGGAFGLGSGFGPGGFAAGAFAGGIIGEYGKFLIKDNIPTIKEENARKVYEGKIDG